MTDETSKTWNETYQKLIVDLKKDVKNLNDRIQQLVEFNAIKNISFNYALTIIQDLLSNSDEYARQRAVDFLKEVKGDNN
jgi:tRNA uridine 5-carbamoylmethylation protein Kti12